MFRVIADRREESSERCLSRDRFKALAFSYEISRDEQAGSLRMEPGGRELKVGAERGSYMRIWVFLEADSALMGILECERGGVVRWTTQRGS